MKTARDIRSSLARARHSRAPCRTTREEQEIHARLEREGGPILPDDVKQEIARKELKRRGHHTSALHTAQRKILRQKERAQLVQDIRLGNDENASPGTDRPATHDHSSKDDRGRRFNAIHVEY